MNKVVHNFVNPAITPEGVVVISEISLDHPAFMQALRTAFDVKEHEQITAVVVNDFSVRVHLKTV